VDGLLATKSEGVVLTVRAISFQDFQRPSVTLVDKDHIGWNFQPMWSLSTNVTDGRTDGQM